MLRRGAFIAAKDLRLAVGGGQGLVQAMRPHPHGRASVNSELWCEMCAVNRVGVYRI